MTSLSFGGSYLGTVIAMPVSGYLCDHGFKTPPHKSRWPSVFYVFGTLEKIINIDYVLVH